MARGGKRPGAGRRPGSRNEARPEHVLAVGDLARSHTETAIMTLVRIMMKGDSEAARVSAAKILLDRGYGLPRTPVFDDDVNPVLNVKITRTIVDPVSDAALENIARNGKWTGMAPGTPKTEFSTALRARPRGN